MTQHNKSGADEAVCEICDSPACSLSANGKYYCSQDRPSWQEEELGPAPVADLLAIVATCSNCGMDMTSDGWLKCPRCGIQLRNVAPVADAGVKRPRWEEAMGRNTWVDYADSLELQLKTVLDRESATAARYDAKLDALELQLAQAREEIAELKALAPRWREQAKGSTHWEGCYLDHRACAISRVSDLEVTLTQTHGKNVELAERVGKLEAHLRKMCNHGRYVRDTNKSECALPSRFMDEALSLLSSTASGKDGE